MKFTNLEQLRNHSGKTLEEVASILGVAKSTVYNWEKEPENVPIGKLAEYAKAINYSLEDLFYKEPTKIKTSLNVKANQNLTDLRTELKNNIKLFSSYFESNNDDFVLGNKNILASILNDMKNLQVGIRKPRVAVVGESDSGKSTLINYLLEQGDLLPARWTPATGSVVKIAHIDDKPTWLVGNTVVIKSDKDSIIDETWNLNDSKYNDDNYFKEHVIKAGNRELISSFGDRDGHNYKHSLEDVYTIYTFLDSEILKTIEIWDTPGIGAGNDNEGESDEALSIYAQTNADMLIYLSVSNQFMHTSDVAYLRQAIKRIDKNSDFKEHLPAWNNLFIVASQAHIVKDKFERENILNRASERLLNQFGEDFLDKDNGYNSQSFRKRFFTFTKEESSIRNDFENELNTILENKSKLILSDNKSLQQDFYSNSLSLLSKEIEENRKLLVEKKAIGKELEEAINNLETVLDANLSIEKKLKDASDKGRTDSELAFRKFYETIMTEEKLLEWVDSREIKNKKDEKKDFNTWLSGKLQDKLENILTENGEEFKEEFEKIGSDIQKKSNINVNSFDFTSVMAGLVASGIVGGAFTIIAAGITSNLGLYILVAQVGGLLTSIGVISSPIVLTSFVSATLGPVGWAISLSILAGIAVSWVFKSSSWKKKFVKQIISAYSKNDALAKFIEASNQYWDNTDESILKLKESMGLVANENINLLQKKYNSNSDDLDLAIYQLVMVEDMLEE